MEDEADVRGGKNSSILSGGGEGTGGILLLLFSCPVHMVETVDENGEAGEAEGAAAVEPTMGRSRRSCRTFIEAFPSKYLPTHLDGSAA